MGKLTEHRHPVNKYRLFRRADVEPLLRKIEDPTPVAAPRKRANRPQ